MNKYFLWIMAVIMLVMPLFSGAVSIKPELNYRYAKWKCQGDRSYTVQGGPTFCRPQSLWKKYATLNCADKCRKGKPCGLKIFSTYERCVGGPVVASSSINLLSPNGGESYVVGSFIDIVWKAVLPAGSGVYIELRPKYGGAKKIGFATSSSNYSWKIPEDVASGQIINSDKYKVEVYKTDASGNIDSNESVKAISDDYFTISTSTPQATSSIISVDQTPSALAFGTSTVIRWTDTRPERYYNILLRERGTNKQYALKWQYDTGDAAAASKSFRWTVGKMIDGSNNENSVDISPLPVSGNLFVTVCHTYSAPCGYSDRGVLGNGFQIIKTQSQADPSFSVVSTDKGVVVSPSVGASYLTQSITFRVTAADEDVYLLKGASRTGSSYGVNGNILANNSSSTYATTTQSLTSVDAMMRTNSYLIPAGTSKTFTWTNTITPPTGSAGNYQSIITAFHWNTVDSATGAQTYDYSMGEFQTDPQYIGAQLPLEVRLANVLSAVRSLLRSLSTAR